MSNQKQFGIAIAGCGDIGWTNAMSVASSQHARVACIFDPNISLAQELARKLRAPVCEKLEEALAREDVEAVLLSVPHHLHAPLAIQCARAGKHVLVEKPLANTTEEATRMVNACVEAGVQLSVNYSFRYSSRLLQVRGLIEEGILGEPAGVSVQHFNRKGIAYWSGGYYARTPDSWRASKAKAGGGILIMGLVHSLDYMETLLRDPIVKVYAEYATRGTAVEVEDTISMSCRFRSGAVGNWSASTCYWGAPVIEERIWGSAGTIVLKPDPAGFFLGRRVGKWSPNKQHKLPKAPETDHRALWIDRFAESIRSGRAPEISWQDGWHLTALVEAAYRSQELGRSVDVAPVPEIGAVQAGQTAEAGSGRGG